MNNIVDIKLVEDTINYLAKKPYIEVVELLGRWSAVIKPQTNENQTNKADTKTEEKVG